MADVVINAPGTANNPYTNALLLTSLGTSSPLASTVTGIRSAAAGDYSEFAHNASYGSVITITVTIASGAASNGDELWIGPTVRSGPNIGSGFGLIIQAASAKLAVWTGAAPFGGSSSISSSAITRVNGDVWTLTSTVVAGTASLVVLQNSTPITFGVNTTTSFTGEASLAAGGAFNAQNNNSLFISQFTGTGVVNSATFVPHAPIANGGFNVQIAM